MREQLQPGERILWCGRPTRGPLERYTIRVFTLGVLSAVGVGVGWLIYVLFGYWVYSTDEQRSAFYATLKALAPIAAHVVVAALGVASLAGLVGMIRGRWLTPRTVYAVTDRRVLFIQATSAIRWIGHRELRDVTTSEHPDGTGDLVFVRNRSDLELLNNNQLAEFPRNWLGDVVERVGLDRLGVHPPDDPGIREAFVGIANPWSVRELVLANLEPRGDAGT